MHAAAFEVPALRRGWRRMGVQSSLLRSREVRHQSQKRGFANT